MRFSTEIASIYCYAIYIWHSKYILFNLWVKLKLFISIFKRFHRKHPFWGRNWRNIKTSVLSKFLYVLHYHYRETYFVCLMLLLMYANAVLLTAKMWACLTLQLRLNYSFRTNNMAFSFRTLIWFFSKKTHSCHQLERPRL